MNTDIIMSAVFLLSSVFIIIGILRVLFSAFSTKSSIFLLGSFAVWIAMLLL